LKESPCALLSACSDLLLRQVNHTWTTSHLKAFWEAIPRTHQIRRHGERCVSSSQVKPADAGTETLGMCRARELTYSSLDSPLRMHHQRILNLKIEILISDRLGVRLDGTPKKPRTQDPSDRKQSLNTLQTCTIQTLRSP